jgi:outer membrane protein
MKKIAWLLCLLVILGTWTINPVQADGLKIGVVDVQRVIKDCVAGKDATRRLKQKQNERASDMESRKAEIAALKKSIEELDPVLEKEARDKKKSELAGKTQAMKDAESRYSKQVRDINSNQSSNVKSEVLRIIEQVAKKGGFSFILDKNHALYSGGAVDITGQVIEEYDMEYQRTR